MMKINKLKKIREPYDTIFMLLKKADRTSRTWYDACFFLNRLIGLEGLTAHEEDLMILYWQSLLILHRSYVELDEAKKHRKEDIKLALSILKTAKWHHGKVVALVKSYVLNSGKANDN